MKTDLKFLAPILVTAFLMPLTMAKAGDDLTYRVKENTSSQKAVQKGQRNAATAEAKVRQRKLRWSAEDWRATYYTHAYATPWWPNAPGG